MTPLRRWAWGAALVAAVVFLPALANGFAYDDRHIIAEHEALHDLSNLPALWVSPYWPLEGGETQGLWRPATTTALSVAWAVGGGSPLPFHLLNLILHAAASALVVLVLARLLPVLAAGVAGVAFALHPVHVEAVANGVGLSELLSAVLILAALLAAGGARERLSGGRLATVAGLYVLAALSKEGAYAFPALLLVWDAARVPVHLTAGGRSGPGPVTGVVEYVRTRGLLLGTLGVIGLALLLVRKTVLGSVASAPPPLGADLLLEIPRMPTVGIVWAEVLRLLAFPWMLSPDYGPGYIPVATVWTPRAVFGVSAVLVVMASALWAARQVRYGAGVRGKSGAREPTDGPVDAPGVQAGPETSTISRVRAPTISRALAPPIPRALAFAVPWFVLTFLPVTHLLFVAGVMLGERTLYLPSVGVAALAGAVAQRGLVGRRAKEWGVVCAAVAFLLGARTVLYVPVWKDDAAVFSQVATAVPESGRAQWVLGTTAFRAGRTSEGLHHYARAMNHIGYELSFLLPASREMLRMDRPDLATVFAARAADAEPARAEPWTLQSLAAFQAGRWAGVLALGDSALARTPSDSLALVLTSVGAQRTGDPVLALTRREALVNTHGSSWDDWITIGRLRLGAGDAVGALAAADSARVRTRRDDQVGATTELERAARTRLGAAEPPGGRP